MASYLVTGVSRGLGFELLRQISADANNIVVGLVRDKATTDKKVKAELGDRPNIHIIEADLTDYESLKKSVDVVSPIVNDTLDYIIANAGLVSHWSQYDGIGTLGTQTPKELEEDMLQSFKINVIGNVHLFNLYLPLILRGSTKKIIALSTGMADIDLQRDYKLATSAPYSISKTALNMAVAKFHAQYADQGVLFLALCPGLVDTGTYDDATEEQMIPVMEMGAKFMQYAPDFNGAAQPPAVSVEKILKVVDLASLEDGYGGAFISHRGKGEKWL